jgi:hypothetical protein
MHAFDDEVGTPFVQLADTSQNPSFAVAHDVSQVGKAPAAGTQGENTSSKKRVSVATSRNDPRCIVEPSLLSAVMGSTLTLRPCG